MYLFSIGLTIQQNHENCCSLVLWHRLWLSLFKLPSTGMFWLHFDKNHQNATLSIFQKSLSLNFWFFLEQLSFKALKYFSLFLIQVEIILGKSPNFLQTASLDRPFSIFLSALHFSFSVLTENFLFNILKSTTPGRQPKKN